MKEKKSKVLLETIRIILSQSIEGKIETPEQKGKYIKLRDRLKEKKLITGQEHELLEVITDIISP